MAREPNPYRRYKNSLTGWTWAEIAELLEVSESHMRALGSGGRRGITVNRSREFERLSGGALKARALLNWSLDA